MSMVIMKHEKGASKYLHGSKVVEVLHEGLLAKSWSKSHDSLLMHLIATISAKVKALSNIRKNKVTIKFVS